MRSFSRNSLSLCSLMQVHTMLLSMPYAAY